MGLVSPTQSSPGDTIEADDINTPINQLAAVINGGIENSNINSSAAIDGSKVTDKSQHTVQTVGTMFNAVATGTTLIPLDDTIPQITEGNEFMTQVITPKSSSNILYIDVTVVASYSVLATMTAALFQDSTANALAAAPTVADTATGMYTWRLQHKMTAGTNSATTFRVRVGAENAGTVTFNGVSGARRYGDLPKSSIVVREVAA
jgi:hypothetical protein